MSGRSVSPAGLQRGPTGTGHQLHAHVGWVYQITKKGTLQGNPRRPGSMRLEIATGNTNFSVSRSYSRIHIGSVDPSSRISRDFSGLGSSYAGYERQNLVSWHSTVFQ